MGFPSLTAALDEAEASKPKEVGSQTLFGFPAHKSDEPEAPAEPAALADFEEDESDATSILPASAFDFDQLAADLGEPPAAVTAAPEDDLRGTVAGMIATTPPNATTDASGTAVFPGMRIAADDEDDRPISTQGTLVGMTLAELTAHAPPPPTGDARSTQFAIPAVQAEKPEAPKPIPSLPSASTTQAWRPGLLDEKENKSGEEAESDARTRLMNKLRKSRPELPPLSTSTPPMGSPTPDATLLDRLHASADSKAAAPSASILRPAKRPTPTPSAETPSADESLEDLSDPEFGLMETDIVSAEMLKEAFGTMTPAEPTPAPTPEPTPAPPAAQGQEHSGRDNSQDSGARTPEPFRPTTPPMGRGEREQPSMGRGEREQPTPTQDFPPVDSHPNYNPFQPQQHTPQPQQYTPQPQQQTPQPQRQQLHSQPVQPPAPVAAAEQHHPHYATPMPAPHDAQVARPNAATTTSPSVAEEDKTVATLQSAVATGAGAVAVLAVVASLLFGGWPGIFRTLILLFGGALGLVMVLAARLPIPQQIRTIALIAIAIVMFVCCAVGLMFGLSRWFALMALAAMVGLVAVAFPVIAKHLG